MRQMPTQNPMLYYTRHEVQCYRQCSMQTY